MAAERRIGELVGQVQRLGQKVLELERGAAVSAIIAPEPYGHGEDGSWPV